MMKFLTTYWKRLLIAVILVVIFFMMADLNIRLNHLYRLTEQRNVMQTDIAYLVSTKSSLETRVAYAGSDKAVEDWARVDARMARPGDNVIILQTAAEPVKPPPAAPTPTTTPVENWQIWRLLIFGR